MNELNNKNLIPLLVIIGGSVLLLISFGLRHAFGLYLIPISDHLTTGRELFSFASALNVLMIGIGSPLFGALSDKYGSGKASFLGIVLVILTMLVTYGVYKYFGNQIKTENYLDIFTSGIFFTAMWYMANKKLENWVLWIFADLITVPLYAYRGLGILSIQYLIFTILAIQGYLSWEKTLNKKALIL